MKEIVNSLQKNTTNDQLTISMGPEKCGDPRVTSPVPSQEEEERKEEGRRGFSKQSCALVSGELHYCNGIEKEARNGMPTSKQRSM